MRLPVDDLERLRSLAQSILTAVQIAETMNVHYSSWTDADVQGYVMNAKIALGRADDAVFALLDLEEPQ